MLNMLEVSLKDAFAMILVSLPITQNLSMDILNAFMFLIIFPFTLIEDQFGRMYKCLTLYSAQGVRH